jgi:glycosyltransferase involved in cell wall biosynthesis
LSQTFRDYEFIVVNDGSIDATQQILEDYVRMDNRIKLIVNDGNIGPARSLNRAITEATGRHIAIKDAGDLAHPELLARQIKLLDEREEIYIVGSRGYWIDENEQIISRWDVPLRIGWNELYDGASMINSSIMIRKELFDKIGLYKPSYAEDLELYAKALKNRLSIANVPEYLISVRKRDHGQQFRKLRANRVSIFAIKLRYLPYFFNAHNLFHTIKSFIGCLLPNRMLYILANRWITKGTTTKES